MNLVIGGSGFIGSHLVMELVRQQEQLRVFDRDPFPVDSEYQPDEIVQGDILIPDDLIAAMKGCTTVYHLAGTPQLWSRDATAFDRLNRQGTENVLTAARQTDIKRLVFTSTESILAPTRGHEPVTEKARPRLEDMPGPYCRSKFLAEQAVFKAADEGLNAVVVCPTLPIGPGDRNLTPPGQMMVDFLTGKIPGYLDCTLNFADVRDMAIWHRLAAHHGEPGRRYILSGYNLSLYDFFQHLSRESGQSMPKLKVPYTVALAWSYVEHVFGLVTGKKPKSSITGVKLCKRSLAFDGTWTWKTLGHQPRPLEESIKDAVAWHQGNL
ncbi:MAG: NAD-dependent epimerase/dehydratase family protein [Thermodesulfobacteriota bacterium]|nr:NAD-dependent epimerase/dehydratase family protein [Thermodesulfobacteriota bacterium]